MFKCFRVLKNAKRPLIKDFLKGESDETVQDWINQGGNYGVLTGEVNNIIVLDLDNHKVGQDTGLDNLNKYMLDNQVGLTPTYTVVTASGGLHLYYAIPEEFKGKRFHQNINKLPSIDFQHNGRYVVGANSVVDDNGYRIERDIPIVEAPEWVMKLYLNENSANGRKGNRTPNKTAQTLNFMVAGVSEGSRNQWIAQLTGKLLATGAELNTVAHMVKLANDNFVKPPLDQAELKQTFQSMVRKDKRQQKTS